MKSLFEEMGGTYRKEGDYYIPNLELPPMPDYQIGKYGRMRRSYLKEHRRVNVVAIERNEDFNKIKELFLTEMYSRLPPRDET